MFRRLLLALEDGDAGSVAVSFTVALAKTCHAYVDVVHVNEYVLGQGGLSAKSSDEAAEVVTKALRELHAAGVDATGMTYRTSRIDLAAAIADLARECRSDAIVVGSHRRRRLGKGRTRERIAARTPLPVVTAPAPLRVRKRECSLDVGAGLDLPVRS